MIMVYVIDVSSYQNDRGPIDWARVAQSGRNGNPGARVDAVYIRLGGGDEPRPYADRFAADNARGAWFAGLPFGFYWVASPMTTNNAQEARLQEAVATVAPASPLLPFAVDVELGVAPAVLLNALDFADRLPMVAGRGPLIYTRAGFWNPLWRRLPQSTPFPRFRLWVANYYVATPVLPDPWTSAALWQYTDQAQVAGIVGPVDHSKADEAFWGPLVEAPKEKRRVTAADGLRIRPAPVAAGAVLGMLAEGAVVEVESTGGGWHTLRTTSRFTVGGLEVSPQAIGDTRPLPRNVYISAAWTVPV